MIITNARIVTAEEDFLGSIEFEVGKIRSFDAALTNVSEAINWHGDYLLPGIIELHTDNIERHALPRPGVRWPLRQALLDHDRLIVSSGITTVFDAIAIGYEHDSVGVRPWMEVEVIPALKEVDAEGFLKASHFIHLRCEVSGESTIDSLLAHLESPLVRLISLMDHTPGQRQWRDLERYRNYQERHRRLSSSEWATQLEDSQRRQKEFSAKHWNTVIALASKRGLPLASHDDTDESHVDEAAKHGIRISEFPTTRVAAQAARKAGMSVVMGAPNLVRSESHSGNVSARELANLDLLDILSSDYVPSSSLQAAFLLHERDSWPLPKAIATVTMKPAAVVGLTDRGQIEIGKRADLLRVHVSRNTPAVVETYVKGKRVS
jgi:alpha-D-ribose 1-methylphosphonate 5-triphosphate diphosphatase